MKKIPFLWPFFLSPLFLILIRLFHILLSFRKDAKSDEVMAVTNLFQSHLRNDSNSKH